MANNTRELLTAAELARCCQVDAKTIHNWAARGDLPHFRTPGRHLRFHKHDVLDFLRRYGYPIPGWLLGGLPRVTVLGPASATASLGAELGEGFLVSTFSDLQVFLLDMGAAPPDVAVLITDASGHEDARVDVVRALREHPRTRLARLVVVGGRGAAALRAGASAHLPNTAPAALRETMEALLGLGRVTE